MKKKTIALFGATGSTGKEFLTLALQQNYSVKALVRSSNGIETTDSNLQLIKGDFSNKEAISKTIENSDFIVCLAGSLKSPQKNLMYNFIKTLHPLMLEQNVPNLIYQGGALCYLPNKKRQLSVVLMRNTIGRMTGLEMSLADHDNVLHYFDTQMAPDGLNIVVTLPGAAGLTSGPSERKLVQQKGVVFKSSRFVDVARFTIENIDNQNLYGKYLYIV